MRRAYCDTSHGQIHFRIGGSGEPVLLLHSTPRSSWEYELMIPILARRYMTIAMDTLGYGESDRPSRQYEISDYAESVVDFLNALNVGRAHIVGHHTGATIAAEVAASYSKQVGKLILSGYPLYMTEERQMLLEGTTAPLPGNYHLPEEIKEDGSHLTAMWNHVKESRKPPMRSLEELHQMVMNQIKGAPSRRGMFFSIWRYDAISMLPLISCPTLVVNTTGDVLSYRSDDTAKLIPGSKLITIRSGNYLPHNAPDKFAQAILNFLDN